jgi:hypothetical protein
MFPALARFFSQFGTGLALCVLCAACSLTVPAQSGRRLSKSPSVSVPDPEAKQSEKKAVTRAKPEFTLIVGGYRGDVFEGIPTYYYETVLQSCSRRLDDSQGVHVDVASKEMTRSDAVNRARAEKEAYVVWLQLRRDAYAGGNSNLDSIYVEYTVFEPTTAKVKTQGNCYQGIYRTGGVVLSPKTSGRNNTVITEGRLKDAAREAAERILKALHVALPSDIPPH